MDDQLLSITPMSDHARVNVHDRETPAPRLDVDDVLRRSEREVDDEQ